VALAVQQVLSYLHQAKQLAPMEGLLHLQLFKPMEEVAVDLFIYYPV
jgi:hypothetical protein